MSGNLTHNASMPCPCCGRTGLRWRRRGLCTVCFRQTKANGTFADYPTQLKRGADVIEDYRTLVGRDPHMRNVDIASHLGMTEKALEKALARARANGGLDVWRIAVGTRPDIARYGERHGVPVR